LCKWFDLQDEGCFTLREFGLGLQHMAHHHIAHNASIQQRADEYVRLKIEQIAIFGDSCPKGHAMEEKLTRDAAMQCGVCGETQAKGTTMHVCEPCAWTVCASCFQSEGGSRMPVTQPKLVRTQSNAAMARHDPANGIVFGLSSASTAMIKNLFDGLDVECDEYLEASAFARKNDAGTQREAFEELCLFFDPDHDGKITLDELLEGLQNLGHHFIAHDAPIQDEVNAHIRAQVHTFVLSRCCIL